MYWALNFAWKLSSFVIKLCEKNSSVNLRFKIFVVAFRARKLFGTFEKRATELNSSTKCANTAKIHKAETNPE